MKITLKVEIELDDNYVKTWEDRWIDYHKLLFGSEEKAIESLKQNPIDTTFSECIQDCILNEEGTIDCKVEKIKEN